MRRDASRDGMNMAKDVMGTVIQILSVCTPAAVVTL